MSVPACAAECGGRVKRDLAAMGVEAHVTHVPPLVKSDWESLDMTCPHGITWYTEPTSEQMARWTMDGVA